MNTYTLLVYCCVGLSWTVTLSSSSPAFRVSEISNRYQDPEANIQEGRDYTVAEQQEVGEIQEIMEESKLIRDLINILRSESERKANTHIKRHQINFWSQPSDDNEEMRRSGTLDKLGGGTIPKGGNDEQHDRRQLDTIGGGFIPSGGRPRHESRQLDSIGGSLIPQGAHHPRNGFRSLDSLGGGRIPMGYSPLKTRQLDSLGGGMIPRGG